MFKYKIHQLVFYIKDGRIHSAPILSRLYVDNYFPNTNLITEKQTEAFNKFGKTRKLYATIHGIYKEDDLYLERNEVNYKIIS